MPPFYKIIVLVVLLFAGTLLASLLMVGIALLQGIELQTVMQIALSGEGEFPRSLLRSMLWVQGFAGFLLPAGVFTWIFYRQNWKQYLRIHRPPDVTSILFAVVALAASYPLVQLTFEANTALPLPEWMRSLEDNAAAMLRDILTMETPWSFVVTLFIVAVLPGIGEELVFRGILQREITVWTMRPVLSVWIAAIVFSAVHMQFEGFLPRVALGAVLGFLYLWSRNLWIPIIVHAVNNGVQVSVLYFTGTDLSAVDQQETMSLNAWIVTGSVMALYLCYRMISKPEHPYAKE